MPWSLRRPRRTFDQRLDNADLEAQASARYHAGPLVAPPATDDDPGRFRYTPFFAKMYGAAKAQVQSRLAWVDWAPSRRKLQVTTVNGVDKHIAAIGRELNALPRRFHRCFNDPAKTFDWRPIFGTQRTSMHSFGIAIDLNSDFADYWELQPPEPWHNRMPYEVVSVFERHKFVWGGKWFHYDTAHFEYRPELF